MAAGNISIMTLTGGTSTNVGGSSINWRPNLTVAPVDVSISCVMNSTATTPNYSIWFTNDDPISTVTATSSSASTFNTSNTTVTWFTSLGATNSSNAFFHITWPFRGLTLVASAGSSSQTITATIIQSG